MLIAESPILGKAMYVTLQVGSKLMWVIAQVLEAEFGQIIKLYLRNPTKSRKYDVFGLAFEFVVFGQYFILRRRKNAIKSAKDCQGQYNSVVFIALVGTT